MTRCLTGLVCLSALVHTLGCKDPGRSEDDDGSSTLGTGGSTTTTASAGGTGGTSTVGSGGSAPFGMPEVLAPDLNLPMGVAVDDTHVYWSETGTWEPNYLYNGKIVRMPKAGGAMTTLANNGEFPRQVHSDGTSVYWLDNGTSDFVEPAHPGRVRKVAVGGGTPSVLTSSAAGNGFHRMMASDTHLYFSAGFWEIRRVPKAGGQDALVVGGGDDVNSFTLDATSVYWTSKPLNETIGSIQKIGLAGGATTPIADVTEPGAVAVSSDTIFWIEEGENLMSRPLAGGTATPIASGSAIVELLVDGDFLYWADCGGGAVVAIPLGGGDPINVATGLGCAMGLAVDDTYVYWVDRGEQFTFPPPKQHAGQVMRATKGKL
jgi:hypothetical protein